MNQSTFSRLIELSSLPQTEREAVFGGAEQPEIRGYVFALESMFRLRIPEPASAKKLAGRAQLLNEVAASREKPAAWSLPLRLLPGFRGAAVAAAVGTVLVATATAGSSLAGWSSSGGAFSEVLSALGLQSQAPTEAPVVAPVLPSDLPGINSDLELPLGSPTTDLEEENVGPVDEPEEPSALPPGQVLDPPAQGGENPGQGVDPPGQGGENPGQGVDPPGQGGENPGQGVDPPGQGGENPGQSVDPPGHDGENPGQGDGPSEQSSENPGQGSGPSEQSSENPGQGSSPPGQGSGSNGNGNENKP